MGGGVPVPAQGYVAEVAGESSLAERPPGVLLGPALRRFSQRARLSPLRPVGENWSLPG